MVRREDDQVCGDREAQVKILFNLSTASTTTYSRGRRRTTQQSAPYWTSSRGRNSTSRRSVTTWFRWQCGNTDLCYSSSSYLRMVESLLVQQQWYDVKRARNQKTSGMEFDRRDVRRHQIRGGSAPSPVRSCCTRNWPLQTTWYIMEIAQDRLHDTGENVFTLEVSQRLLALFGQTPDD